MKKKVFIILIILGIMMMSISLKMIADYSREQREIAAIARREQSEKELQEIEEQRLKEEKQKQLKIDQERKNYATKIPYEGMKEVFIDDTIVGKHQKYECTGTISKYCWYSANGEDLVLVVSCKNEEVFYVTKFFEDVYWDHNGMPQFDKKKREATKNYGSGYTDKYDAQNYDNPDDFAYEWEDAFDDYDEAYDYWENYH